MRERRGNVHENKGSGFRRPVRGGNVAENKDTYEFMAGMLLKRKEGRGFTGCGKRRFEHQKATHSASGQTWNQ